VWSEADIQNERWNEAQAKGRDKGRWPFEAATNLELLPPSLRPACTGWLRPSDVLKRDAETAAAGSTAGNSAAVHPPLAILPVTAGAAAAASAPSTPTTATPSTAAAANTGGMAVGAPAAGAASPFASDWRMGEVESLGWIATNIFAPSVAPERFERGPAVMAKASSDELWMRRKQLKLAERTEVGAVNSPPPFCSTTQRLPPFCRSPGCLSRQPTST
jgi:hypothetical protein